MLTYADGLWVFFDVVGRGTLLLVLLSSEVWLLVRAGCIGSWWCTGSRCGVGCRAAAAEWGPMPASALLGHSEACHYVLSLSGNAYVFNPKGLPRLYFKSQPQLPPSSTATSSPSWCPWGQRSPSRPLGWGPHLCCPPRYLSALLLLFCPLLCWGHIYLLENQSLARTVFAVSPRAQQAGILGPPQHSCPLWPLFPPHPCSPSFLQVGLLCGPERDLHRVVSTSLWQL
jgi:hypothetical protein